MTSAQDLQEQLQHLDQATLKKIAPSIIAQVRQKAAGDFRWFVHNVFSASFPKFIEGQYIEDVITHLEENPYTMDVTGRNHFKSTRLYADIMWRLLSERDTGWEGWYFSFSHDLAAYHIAKIKEYIKDNIYFMGIIDHKLTAESVLQYSWDGHTKMTLKPSGLLSFKRGIHADHIYIDDPLQDPDNKLVPTSIYKINAVLKQQLLPMINKGGTCRIVGTPQTPEDFFFDKIMQKTFKFWITPAIVDEPNGIALWPEWMSFEELVNRREQQGERIFNPEYMASPVYAENAYISRQQLVPLCTETSLPIRNHSELNDEIVTAGFDVGKKVHPSHLAVFKRISHYNPETDDEDIEYQQLLSLWMDGWDYGAQVEMLNNVIEYFNVKVLRFDNTRAELESFKENGKLSHRAEPVTFSAKNQEKYAASFGALVDKKKIAFVNESRQINQIVAVTSDLQAINSPEGHGDSFFSCALGTYEEKRRTPNIRVI
jgi:hypothetical protein